MKLEGVFEVLSINISNGRCYSFEQYLPHLRELQNRIKKENQKIRKEKLEKIYGKKE